MTTFLNPNVSNVTFVNFKEYINALFSKHIIRLICPKNKVDIICRNHRDAFIVKCNNPLLEGNLRIVESYLPELLFHLVANGYCTTGSSFYSLINTNNDLDNAYIKYKLFRLFEAVIFSDFFEVVFSGNLNVTTCYVLKTDELKYYTVAYSGILFYTVLDGLCFDINRYQNHTSDIIDIRVLYKQKPH